jgi:hypothetical protein
MTTTAMTIPSAIWNAITLPLPVLSASVPTRLTSSVLNGKTVANINLMRRGGQGVPPGASREEGRQVRAVPPDASRVTRPWSLRTDTLDNALINRQTPTGTTTPTPTPMA